MKLTVVSCGECGGFISYALESGVDTNKQFCRACIAKLVFMFQTCGVAPEIVSEYKKHEHIQGRIQHTDFELKVNKLLDIQPPPRDSKKDDLLEAICTGSGN
jgi:hypothetical protein